MWRFFRTGSKPLAAGTLLCDVLKGFLPAFVAGFWSLDVAVVAGFFALIGHMYPVWLGFKGGKGVATFIGLLAGLYWPLAVSFCAIWLLVAALFKMSSLSSLTATTLTPIAAFVFDMPALVVPLSLMTVIIFWKHRENIQRLLKGEESKIKLRNS